MKFRSPNGADIRITSTTGHVAVVGADWRELPEVLHLEALARGCECDQERMSAQNIKPKSGAGAMNQTPDADGEYRKALATMIERGEEGDFTGADLPNINVVSKLCGFSARKEDVLRVFRAMTAEATTDATAD